MTEFWLHPALILILGSLVLPLVPSRLRRVYLLLIPVLTFARVIAMSPPLDAA